MFSDISRIMTTFEMQCKHYCQIDYLVSVQFYQQRKCNWWHNYGINLTSKWSSLFRQYLCLIIDHLVLPYLSLQPETVIKWLYCTISPFALNKNFKATKAIPCRLLKYFSEHVLLTMIRPTYPLNHKAVTFHSYSLHSLVLPFKPTPAASSAAAAAPYHHQPALPTLRIK